MQVTGTNSKCRKPKPNVFAYEMEESSGFRHGPGALKRSPGAPLPLTVFLVALLSGKLPLPSHGEAYIPSQQEVFFPKGASKSQD